MAVISPVPAEHDLVPSLSLNPEDAARRRVTGDFGPALSIVLPCLDEAESITQCVRAARAALDDNGIAGEILVVDNGSSDGSAELAAAAGATVIHERRRGYGNAYRAGFAMASGEYILMADADLTYDFADAPRFIAALDAGADLVIGNRMDNIHPGAMPWLHRYVGNPLLSGLLKMMFDTRITDAHCGMRAFRRDVIERLDLRTSGMEFASEMVIRAAKEELEVCEFPIEYRPRGGESKLSSFRDGWRHLRFLLVHSPRHLFVLPGALMASIGILIQLVVVSHIGLLGRDWQVHAAIAGLLLTVVGSQVVALGACAQAYGAYYLGERDEWFDRLRSSLKLEDGLMAGGALITIGGAVEIWICVSWMADGFGSLGKENLAVAAATLIIVGIQVFFTSFLLSILGLRRR